jgi:hypothetical protein
MPVRFRCVYCDKLLGIARRKAGAVVNCPQCGQPLIVPTPEPEPTAAAGVPSAPPKGPSKLFERDDFEAILQGDVTLRTPDAPSRRPREDRRTSANPLPPKPFPVEQSLPAVEDPEPPYTPRPRVQPGVVLTTGMLVLLIVGVLLLVGIAFGGGIVVGRMLH